VLLRLGRLVPIVDLATVPSLWNAVPGTGGDQVVVLAAGEIEAGLLVRQVETLTPGSAEGDSGAAAAPSEVREAILWGAIRARGRDWDCSRSTRLWRRRDSRRRRNLKEDRESMAKKILLADDSITIQKVVELTFSEGDYEVHCVGNGALAIRKIDEIVPTSPWST